jgi:cyclopropane fatty-acyl-phospholipid synthase-like methyltransferase
MSLKGKLAVLLNKRDLKLDLNIVDAVIKKNGNPQWFSYIIKERPTRWDVYLPAYWIAWNIRPEAKILESGCGIGSNLMWLAQNGFKNLSGFDIDEQIIRSGNEIIARYKFNISLYADDGLNPDRGNYGLYDLVIALNWTYYNENFDIFLFLSNYAKLLNPDGILIMDAIDQEYDNVINNQYLSSDWDKPAGLRAPSEYRIRYSMNDIQKAASQNNFKILRIISRQQGIPRKVYVLKKNKIV